MKQTSITEASDISDLNEAPKLTPADFGRAEFRVEGQPVSRETWAAAARTQLGKQRVNIMLDKPVVEYFKALAGERGYQTLINETLRRSMETKRLKADLRQIIREELAAAR
jgi:uncharacterized protein (DUF4415 family)